MTCSCFQGRFSGFEERQQALSSAAAQLAASPAWSETGSRESARHSCRACLVLALACIHVFPLPGAYSSVAIEERVSTSARASPPSVRHVLALSGQCPYRARLNGRDRERSSTGRRSRSAFQFCASPQRAGERCGKGQRSPPHLELCVEATGVWP